MNRELSALCDGIAFAGGCRIHLSGKTGIGLFPSLFLLQCMNLSDADVFRLRNTNSLSVSREDSCLAFGKVSDVFRETVPEGTVTTVAFSLGLDLWEAQISLSVPSGMTVSETVRLLLEASGTGIQFLSFPGEDPACPRGQAFCGRAADGIAEALTAAGGKKMILSTTVTGFQPGEEMTLEADGERRQGLILERMVEADTAYGEWKTQLVVQLS